MSDYNAPIKDMNFVLKNIVDTEYLASLEENSELSQDLIDAVLEEAGRLSSEVWAETNITGDNQGVKLDGNKVITPDGFREAYIAFAEGGWNGLNFPEKFGGQGLPWSLAMATNEMWQSANMALGLCHLLTHAGIEAILHHGSDEQAEKYLHKMISGEWTGTMNLTEPQAGTDLSAIKTIATKDESGDFYRMRGSKIYITYGDHEFTDNIIHLVLARVDGLPEGNNGLGLFIVPKFIVNDDGSLGDRNDVYPVSTEHKLGIHGSPTCVMAYGDNEGAIAYLVGKEGEGLKNMFTMMNNARISVGLQGVAICDRAYQHALKYAKERIQCAVLGSRTDDKVAIIEHADVKRMLLTMRAYTEASRALSYYAGGMIDRANLEKDKDKSKMANDRVALLTPLVKSWGTDLAVEMASLGIQIHGGMGFVEETGAAQHYRDARILPIYEGTNGIQAMDMMFRKLAKDGGMTAVEFIEEMREDVEKLQGHDDLDLDIIHGNMLEALDGLSASTGWLLENANDNAQALASASVLYQRQFATVAGGWLMANSALKAFEQLDVEGEGDFMEDKMQIARFYAESLLPQVNGLINPIMSGHGVVTSLDNDRL